MGGRRFVSCKSMAERAADHVRSGRIQMFPEHHKATWYQWLGTSRGNDIAMATCFHPDTSFTPLVSRQYSRLVHQPAVALGSSHPRLSAHRSQPYVNRQAFIVISVCVSGMLTECVWMDGVGGEITCRDVRGAVDCGAR